MRDQGWGCDFTPLVSSAGGPLPEKWRVSRHARHMRKGVAVHSRPSTALSHRTTSRSALPHQAPKMNLLDHIQPHVTFSHDPKATVRSLRLRLQQHLSPTPPPPPPLREVIERSHR
eukprot:Sspe_Gene.99275::Locus_72720_Transcript_1_1_Confidence_1.000_Length_388::g.99275::m.99275